VTEPKAPDPSRDRDRVAGRKVEPFIYIPRPPKNWIVMRVRTLHDVAVICVGLLLLLSQMWDDVIEHREPHYAIIVAGLTCLGYQGAVWRDRTKRDGPEDHDDRHS
jgi:hypothetical protein